MSDLVIRNVAEIYGPDPVGSGDITIRSGRIVGLGGVAGVPSGENELDGADLIAVPGFVDSHLHIAGGGSIGAGPISREPDFGPSEIWLAGITTAIGTPSADYVTRSLENLLAKARALDREGVTSFIWTGGFREPAMSLTQSIAHDLMVCDKVVGAKIVISDFMAPPRTLDQLHHVVWQTLSGSEIAGKPGVIHVHTGILPPRIEPIREVVARYDYGDVHWSARHGGALDRSAANHFQITHANWNPALLDECIAFALDGGRIDFTAGLSPEVGFLGAVAPSAAVRTALEAGVAVDRLTLSSDAGGSEARLDPQGSVAELLRLRPPRMLAEFRNMVVEQGLAIENAVRITSTNVADLHRWYAKGRVEVGADADLMLLDRDLRLQHVVTRGVVRVQGGRSVRSGLTELRS